MGISIGDIAILNVNGHKIVRPINKDFHISIPKNAFKQPQMGGNIVLSILKLAKVKDLIIRPAEPLINGKLDARFFVPKKTIFGRPIYIIPISNSHSYVWYSHGGGVAHLAISDFADPSKIGELLGFYFGDGTTCKGIRSFRLTSCEPSVLNYCLDIMEELGIRRSSFKVQIIYSTPYDLSPEIKNICVQYWSKILNTDKNRIVSVTASKNPRETIKYGSARLFIDSSVLVEVFLNGLLSNVLDRICFPTSALDYTLAAGFLRGLLAAEGSVNLNKNDSVVRIGIAYDPHSDEVKLYKKLLNNLGIDYGNVHGNELLIGKYKNLKKLNELEAFKMHTPRNEKFMRGFLNHKFTKVITQVV